MWAVLSIPFTSGRSSVPPLASWRTNTRTHFQSPSRRGDHRFFPELPQLAQLHPLSIPFTSGRSSVPADPQCQWTVRRLSIPFTSGRSSVLACRSMGIEIDSDFQSPSRRGDHRFSGSGATTAVMSGNFQSPSRRGDHRFRPLPSLPEPPFELSIPFTSGRSSVLIMENGVRLFSGFQSPSRRGDHRFATEFGNFMKSSAFNPLHVGAIIGSGTGGGPLTGTITFNPLHVGAIIGSLRIRRHT